VSLLMSVFTLSFLAYSRRQEYAADSRAADVTGDPAALARALSKIHRAKQPRSGLFSLLYIHDDRRDDTPTILSTHPPLPDRIDRLADRVEGDVSGQPVARIRIG
jgi:heat shock protein HtpX